MGIYQSFLKIKIHHEYYNARNADTVPVTLIPHRKTAILLRQYGLISKSTPGHLQLIADATLFSDLAELTDKLSLTYFLYSADPVMRSVTKMPAAFDVATLQADFTQSKMLDIRAESWGSINMIAETGEDNGEVSIDKNLIGVLNVSIPKSLLTAEEKYINLRFSGISTYWKYYLFSSDHRKNLTISGSPDNGCAFIEQENEEIAGRSARVFLSNQALPLRKRYPQSFCLMNENKVIMKSLPVPIVGNQSIEMMNDTAYIISHIYFSCI